MSSGVISLESLAERSGHAIAIMAARVSIVDKGFFFMLAGDLLGMNVVSVELDLRASL